MFASLLLYVGIAALAAAVVGAFFFMATKGRI